MGKKGKNNPGGAGQTATGQSASPTPDAVDAAVTALIKAVEDKGVLPLAKIWKIVWVTLDYRLAFKIVLMLLGLLSTGWGAHVIWTKLVPDPDRPVLVERVELPEALAEKTDYISDKAPPWMLPLVKTLEAPIATGTPPAASTGAGAAPTPTPQKPTVFQVTGKLDRATRNGRVVLIRPQSTLTGYAFLVRSHDGGKCYQPLTRVQNAELKFIVDVPEASAGDEIQFLTSLPGTYPRKDLDGLFSIRRSP